MRAAIRAAKRALKEGEVPIGAVVVYGEKVVARGYNRRTKMQLASAHAEMMAIDCACRKFKSWRLPEGCELYVTLEPCPMCMGAALGARVDKALFRRLRTKGALADERACRVESSQPQNGSEGRGGGARMRAAIDLLFRGNAQETKARKRGKKK